LADEDIPIAEGRDQRWLGRLLLGARFWRGLGGFGGGDSGREDGARDANRHGDDPNGAKGREDKTRHQEQSFEPGPTLWPSPGGGLPCRPIRAKFRPSALPADAGAAILHLVTEK
jgi:hypothetical protein